MRLQRLTLRDFKSYQEADLDLSTINLASIIGQNGAGKSSLLEACVWALTGARSMRDQNSFIRQGAEECQVSLEFALGGEVYRITRGRSSRSSGKSTAELCRQSGEAWIAEGSSVREVEARMAEILGLDEKTLLGTAFVSQGDAGSFFALQAAERLSALGTILKLDETFAPLERHFKVAAEEAKAGLEASRRDVERLDLDVERLESKQDELRDASAAVDAARAVVADRETSVVAAQAEAEAAERSLSSLDVTRAKRDELRARKADLERRRLALNGEQTDLEFRVLDKPDLEQRLASRPTLEAELACLEAEREGDRALKADRQRVTEALAATRVTLDQARSDWETAQRQKKAAESALTEARMTSDRAVMDVDVIHARIREIEDAERPVCDRCGQPIESEALTRSVAGLVAEREAAGTRVNNAARAIEQAQQALGEAGNAMAAMLERGNDAREDLDARQAELDALPAPTFDETKHASIELGLSLLAEIPAKLAEITALEERLSVVRSDVAKLDRELSSPELTTDLADAEAAVADGERLAEEARLAKGRVEMCQAVLDGERGKLSQAEKVAARIEGEIATLEPSRARLEETRAEAKGLEVEQTDAELLRKAMSKWGIPSLIIANVLRALEVEVNELLSLYEGGLALRFESEKETRDGSRDSLEILVFDGAAWRPFETFSGGERYRVASAMRLGLALLLAHRSGARVETLVVDEPEGLDAAGRQNLVRILERMSEHFGIVLLCTHYVDLQDAFPSQILVSRGEDGLSRIEVAA